MGTFNISQLIRHGHIQHFSAWGAAKYVHKPTYFSLCDAFRCILCMSSLHLLEPNV